MYTILVKMCSKDGWILTLFALNPVVFTPLVIKVFFPQFNWPYKVTKESYDWSFFRFLVVHMKRPEARIYQKFAHWNTLSDAFR